MMVSVRMMVVVVLVVWGKSEREKMGKRKKTLFRVPSNNNGDRADTHTKAVFVVVTATAAVSSTAESRCGGSYGMP